MICRPAVGTVTSSAAFSPGLGMPSAEAASPELGAYVGTWEGAWPPQPISRQGISANTQNRRFIGNLLTEQQWISCQRRDTVGGLYSRRAKKMQMSYCANVSACCTS